MDSYFSLLNISFVENYHISIFTTTFEKQSMINRLSNLINRNRSAVKISKVMSSSQHPHHLLGLEQRRHRHCDLPPPPSCASAAP